MITGSNTNVRHGGVVFHVQTEDSGRANPHVISHLYHQGTILASQKSEYAEHVDDENLEAVVKKLIETQHGEMLARLKKGDFDAVIDERLNGPSTDGMESPTPMPQMGRKTPTPGLEIVRASAESSRKFGEGIVSQKPLDEVILDYLADKARDRAAGRGDKSAKSHSSG